MGPAPKQFYAFDIHRVDPALGRVHRGGTPVVLPPKTFDLLLLFVRNPNRVLSKSELMQSLWPDTFVEDANLTQHVFTLRKALGVQPGGQPYIETVPRRGYRFTAQVRQTWEADPPPDLPPEPAAPPREVAPSAFDAERKQATILCCGIANAAPLAERLGPAGLEGLVQRVSEIAADEIGRYEGILRQRHPDEFVALFGARVVHEDDARRAVLAALGIQRRLADVASPLPEAEDEVPVVRIGIHSGPVVVSRRPGERGVEYTAVGEAMRSADLLQQVAPPGTILVSDAARRGIEGYIDVVPADPVTPTMAAWRVVDVIPAAARRRTRLTRMLAPFVGRSYELALLQELARKALAGQGQVVTVLGEPGMGKSRLTLEFLHSVGADDFAAPLEGRCVSYGSLVPYLPLSDLLRAHCGASESETPAAVRSAIERAVRDNDLPPDASRWFLRLMGIVDGASALDTLSPEAIKARTFDVLRALFLKASARRPLVIVVEDVHWIDRTSEEFLSTLIERLVAARVMLVATSRPGYRAPWMDRSYATQITLAPLGVADGAKLVGAVTGAAAPPENVAAILARAEGNPFFLEELARSDAAAGADAQGIPDTVHAVIMARLDRLAAGAKQLVQTASVLGREVPLRLLKHVGGSGAHFDSDLMELCRLEFLYERPGRDEPVFVFKHALTQDVAYDSLLARQRRDLHLEAARALEMLYGSRLEEITATLAYHYTRTDLADEAITWLIRAAEQAARVYANAEAILHLDLARRRVERLPEGSERDRRTLRIALLHAHSLYFLGRFAESVDVLLPHAVRLARLDDQALTAAYWFWLAHMQSRLGDQRRTRESAGRAIDAATRAGDEETLGKAHGVLALEGHWGGNSADGIAHGREAVRLLASRPQQRWWLGMAHFYLATNHLLVGDFDAALADAAAADEVGRQMGDPRLQTYAAFVSGWIEASRGNHEAAVALCQRGREQAPDRVSRAYASLFLAYALIERGDHVQARSILEPIADELEGFGIPQWQSFALALAAETCRLAGRLEHARAVADRALDVANRAQYGYGAGFAHRVRARIARDAGAVGDAAAALDDAVRTFERIGASFESTRARGEAAAVTAPSDGSGAPSGDAGDSAVSVDKGRRG
jgi:DNA-binding winged helix-turn-helix (wHTH) protein/tetratricopeptide (TPR) repeat protein